MDYFIVRPDYARIAKYHKLEIPRDALKTESEEDKLEYLHALTKKHSESGIEIFIDAYYKPRSTNPNLLMFGPEHIELVCQEFDRIVKYYDVENHKEDLLYMILLMVQGFNSYHYLGNETYYYNQRIKEISHFLLAIKDNENKSYELNLKSRDSHTNIIRENVIIKDQELIKWMSKLIIDLIEDGKAPVYLFGCYENTISRRQGLGPLTLKELRAAASFKNQTYSRGLNKQSVGSFCLALLPYLNNETALRTKEGKKSSDRQISFLYDVCKLFDLMEKDFDVDSIDVNPVKHLRTLIRDTEKALKKKR
jgi:hypothetical protein